MITFTKAIGKAIDDSMATDESVICYGLGVNVRKEYSVQRWVGK